VAPRQQAKTEESSMSAITPITTMAQLDAIDSDECVAGYMAGYNNQPNYTRTGQAYWHGYMNGQADKGYMPISEEQRELARVFTARSSNH
jgi:hypothetical protein